MKPKTGTCRRLSVTDSVPLPSVQFEVDYLVLVEEDILFHHIYICTERARSWGIQSLGISTVQITNNK